MVNPILITESLTKRFRRIVAVEDLNLEVHHGDIFGFLGPNGAGKTTTIRMVLNLIRPTSGRVFLFGAELPKGFLSAMKRMGAMVESPAFYPYLSGWDNLNILAHLGGNANKERIAEVSRLVRLEDRIHDKVKTYSQGMRQRLGIAQALLHHPSLVILDEPTNSLDPAGTFEVRSLIKELRNSNGVTFILSSHLLHEMELICNRIAIINQGHMVVQGKLDELLKPETSRLRLRATPAENVRDILSKTEWCRGWREEPDGAFSIPIPMDRAGDLSTAVTRAGATIEELTPSRMTLEEYFMKHVEGK